MTINLHHNPVYPGQPEGTYIWWGYGLFPDRTGDFVGKKMADCTGEELLAEALGHLRLKKEQALKVTAGSTCICRSLPYITSQFMPRTPETVRRSFRRASSTWPLSGSIANCRTTPSSRWNIRCVPRRWRSTGCSVSSNPFLPCTKASAIRKCSTEPRGSLSGAFSFRPAI